MDKHYDSVLRQRWGMCNWYNDSYSCNCGKNYLKDQNVGQKLYMDNFFSYLDLFEDLHSKTTDICILSDQIRKECCRILEGK